MLAVVQAGEPQGAAEALAERESNFAMPRGAFVALPSAGGLRSPSVGAGVSGIAIFLGVVVLLGLVLVELIRPGCGPPSLG